MTQDIVTIEPDEGLRMWGWVSYVLHLVVAVAAALPIVITQFSFGLLLIALFIDLVKRSDATHTWQASHFSWRIRSVLWAGFLYVITFPLWLLFFVPGWIAWCVISLWFLYRIVKGMVRMNAGRAVEAG